MAWAATRGVMSVLRSGAALAEGASLSRNDKIYRWLVGWLHGVDAHRHPEETLECVQAVADFATYQHTGRFADGALENVALEIGLRLESLSTEKEWLGPRHFAVYKRSYDRPRILHVSSVIEQIGGGTRALARWIRADSLSRHIVIPTRQAQEPIPCWVAEAVSKSGGQIVQFPPGASLLQKAIFLRRFAQAEADLVFVHHHMDDVIPTVAFAVPEVPPVAVVNDADHMFWLGSTVADATLNWRTIGRELSEQRRFTRHNFTIPLPLDNTQRVPYGEARKKLGIPEDQVVVLSIGRGPKYRPEGRRNFFHTGCKMLERNLGAHLYVIGVSPGEAAPYLPLGGHTRFHFLGPVGDPSLYQSAADVYIEGFPFGSQTALLESAMAGVPAIPAYDPPCKLLVTDDDPIRDLLITPRNEEAYLERAGFLIRHPEERRHIGNQFRDRLVSAHTGEGWLSSLHAVYSEMKHLRHEPQAIGIAECAKTDDDLALCAWLDASATRAAVESNRGDRDSHSASAVDIAHRLRERGYYRQSCRLLWKALRRGEFKRKLLAAMAKLPIHWLCREIGVGKGIR